MWPFKAKVKNVKPDTWADYLLNDRGGISLIASMGTIQEYVRKHPRETENWAVLLGKDFMFIAVSARSYMGLPDTPYSISELSRIVYLYTGRNSESETTEKGQ